MSSMKNLLYDLKEQLLESLCYEKEKSLGRDLTDEEVEKIEGGITEEIVIEKYADYCDSIYENMREELDHDS